MDGKYSDDDGDWFDLGKIGSDPSLLEDSSFKMFQDDFLQPAGCSAASSLASQRVQNVKHT